MDLDISQIARGRARRKNTAGGLGYLLTRIRRELEERWASAHAGDAQSGGKVLLLDSSDDFRLGAAALIQRFSLLDSPVDSTDSTAASLPGDGVGDFDGVVMCLQPAWLDLRTIVARAQGWLRPGGTLLFCTFGPDTLLQLRWAWQQVDELPHVHRFIDMHHIGDQLLECGFKRPMVDVDRVTVEYAEAELLYADLRAEGFTNILRSRRKTLTGKTRLNGFRAALSSLRAPGEPLAITYELIYGVALAPPAPGVVRIPAPQMPRRN